jgi:hypothetical protein
MYIRVLWIGKDVAGSGHGPLREKLRKYMEISQNSLIMARESNSGPPGYEEDMRITVTYGI